MRKVGKERKGWTSEKSNQKFLMIAEFVKNSAMNAKIGPKVVMELTMFKIGGWNNLQPRNPKLLEEFMDEHEPWSLIGIPNRDPFTVTQHFGRHCASSDQHLKGLMSLREGLHVMMQCYMRQHLLIVTGCMNIQEDERMNHLLCERTCVQMECSEDAIRIE